MAKEEQRKLYLHLAEYYENSFISSLLFDNVTLEKKSETTGTFYICMLLLVFQMVNRVNL